MRHFGHIAPEVRQRLFHQEPGDVHRGLPGPRCSRRPSGATLYSPATRPRLADDVVKQAARGVVSMVLCLEDSIDDAEVADAEENLVTAVRRPRRPRRHADLRCCSSASARPGQITDLVRRLGPAVRLLSGFVLPKFTEERGVPFLEALAAAEAASGRRLFAMPVLESPELLHRRRGCETLAGHLPHRRQVPRAGAGAAPRRDRLLLRVRAAQGRPT